jgi:hypothetical protein
MVEIVFMVDAQEYCAAAGYHLEMSGAIGICRTRRRKGSHFTQIEEDKWKIGPLLRDNLPPSHCQP